MAVIIQFRRGTTSDWENVNPILEEGEMGVELDTGRFKVGNGVNDWNTLEYSSGEQGSPGGLVGGTVEGDIDFAGFKAIGPLIKNYAETVSVNNQATGIVDIDLTKANIHELTVTGDITELSFSNPSPSGSAHSFTLILHQRDIPWDITWPAEVIWEEPPVVNQPYTTFILVFLTITGGVRWYGMGVSNFASG